MSYLSNLIRKGNLEKIKNLITKNRMHLKEAHGTIALTQAIREGKFDVIQLLIEHGAEVNDRDKILYLDENPIAQASQKGDLAIVKLLLDAGAEVNIFNGDPEYWTPLMYAVSSGNLDIVKLLVGAGADVNEIRDAGNSALNIAAHCENREIFDYLAPLTSPEIKGISLFIAAHEGYSAIVKALLDAGADPNFKEEDSGNSPLISAINSQCTEIIDWLLQAGVDINTKNPAGKTALMKAAELGYIKIVHFLLQAYADIHIKDNLGENVLSYAQRSGHTKIVQLLLDVGATEE